MARKITYLIDAENHGVGKTVNGVLQTGFLYDDDQVVAQLNASNQIVSQFVYGAGATSPDYMVNGGVTYRIVADQLGSPRLVVNTTTGAIAEQIDYDEFGNVLRDTNPGFQPFGFAGGLYDQDTKLVRFGARDYNPSIGRWTAKDPILFGGGDPNLYGYVLNDPINGFDPTGLRDEDCVCKQKNQSLKGPQPQRGRPGDPIPFKDYTPSSPEGEYITDKGTIITWHNGRKDKVEYHLPPPKCSGNFYSHPRVRWVRLRGPAENPLNVLLPPVEEYTDWLY